MEKIFFVINNRLDEINEELSKGGKVKLICSERDRVGYLLDKSKVAIEYPKYSSVTAYVVVEYPD